MISPTYRKYYDSEGCVTGGEAGEGRSKGREKT